MITIVAISTLKLIQMNDSYAFIFSDIPSNPEYILNCDDEDHVIAPMKTGAWKSFFWGII